MSSDILLGGSGKPAADKKVGDDSPKPKQWARGMSGGGQGEAGTNQWRFVMVGIGCSGVVIRRALEWRTWKHSACSAIWLRKKY